jgi:putative metallohydrolase (TIGR04338 family)
VSPTRSPRDSQRSRVYRAETPVAGRRLPGLPDCAAFVDEVVGSLWWASRFPEHGLAEVPRLRPGQGARQAYYREDPGHPTITLPRRYRTSGVILHELAHWALRDAHDLPVHGRTFTRVLLDATMEFGGAGRAERLEHGYAEHGVRVGRPARLGPDGRWHYEWDERLRLGRDKKLTVRFHDGETATGVLTSRAHATVTLRARDGETIRIREKEIWSVSLVAPASTLRARSGLRSASTLAGASAECPEHDA